MVYFGDIENNKLIIILIFQKNYFLNNNNKKINIFTRNVVINSKRMQLFIREVIKEIIYIYSNENNET